jgi:protein-S-isoprenylcysteine O-methyltransferase Ste14
MTISNWLIAALWLIFVAYWAVMGVGAKRTIGARFRRKQAALLVAVIVLVVFALHFPVFRHGAPNTVSGGTLAATIGVALCAFGIGLAIWARAHLGRNWGMPMARMESPELVTSGPYAFVRHPIYTGMLTAMLGSTFGESPLWLVPLVLFGIYFVYSARNEEKLMLEQFPEQYPEYMSRTKMLVPFVL